MQNKLNMPVTRNYLQSRLVFRINYNFIYLLSHQSAVVASCLYVCACIHQISVKTHSIALIIIYLVATSLQVFCVRTTICSHVRIHSI